MLFKSLITEAKIYSAGKDTNRTETLGKIKSFKNKKVSMQYDFKELNTKNRWIL